LQRIRDYFRQALGNPEVKDKTKADEARKRVEQVSLSFENSIQIIKMNRRWITFESLRKN
jgi:hypothetical protein